MTMRADYDEYDDYDNTAFRWVSVIVLLMAVAGFLSLAWYAYRTGTENTQTSEVMVIEADDMAYKEKPEDPGGMQFPHKDKTIYEAMEAESKKQKSVKLVESEEEPVIPSTETGAKREQADEKIAEIIRKAAEETALPEEKADKDVVEVVKATPKQPDPFAPVAAKEEVKKPEVKKPTPTLVIEKPAPLKPAAPKVAASKATGFGSTQLQLGAFRSQEEAETNWNKIRRSHLDLLDGKSHMVVRADLGAKGVFYRLRASGFDTADATETCSTLKVRNQPCFVVK